MTNVAALRVHARKRFLNAFGLILLLASLAGPAAAQVVHSEFYVPNGPVEAEVISGNTLYIGGSFNHLGPPTGSGIPISAADGSFTLADIQRFDGSVRAAISDGAGGWYVSGSFTKVGGQPRAGLAHLRSDQSLDSGFAPIVTGLVNAVALQGSTLYVGGMFSSVGGQSRVNLAAVDVTTGAVQSWNPQVTGGQVLALAAGGGTVYAGGTFTAVGDSARVRLAAVDAATGLATRWNPAPNGISVQALAVDGSLVYVGGAYSSIGGLARGNVAALDVTTGIPNAWNPFADDVVWAITIDGATVYLGGSFTNVGGIRHRGLVAVGTNGTIQAWNAEASDRVRAITVDASRIYVGGDFGSIGGQNRPFLAALHKVDGTAVAGWDPEPNRIVHAIAGYFQPVLFVGGDFVSVGGITQVALAALDLTTGAPVAGWGPGAGGAVHSLLLSGGTLYVGGDFTSGHLGTLNSLGGQPRDFLGAVNPVTGLATAWRPHVDAPVTGMALDGSTLYLSGGFTHVESQPRSGLAAIGAGTSNVGAFAPSANGTAKVLAAVNGRVYVAGTFTSIGGQPRNHFAALDGATGLAQAWDANPTGSVNAVLPVGTKLYVGGDFSAIGGQPRANLAALDTTTALATAWDPGTNGPVASLAADNKWIYAGGSFTQAAGAPRAGLVAVESGAGTLVSGWHPAFSGGSVDAIAVQAPILAAGGDFSSVNSILLTDLAVLGDVSTPVLASIASVDVAGDRVALVWFAPARTCVAATVYRREGSGGWEARGAAAVGGDGRITFTERGVPPGDYEYRIGALLATGGDEVALGEVRVAVLRAQFSLDAPRPNPSTGILRVAFSLPDAAPARLELIDVSGRLVTARDVGAFGAGAHSLALGMESFPPGLYVLRLVRGGEVHAVRAVRVR